MKYKCIKEFTVAVYDNENDCFLDENMTIKKTAHGNAHTMDAPMVTTLT